MVTQAQINKITKRIVENSQPERVILLVLMQGEIQLRIVI